MERPSDYGAIRLTNKTALALRRCARQERKLYLCAAVIFTLLMAVAAVLLGIRTLVAVPLMTAVTVLLDAAIYVRAHARVLSLTGEAICTEAAARALREERKEKERRARAQRDFSAVQADVEEAIRRTQAEDAPREDDAPPQARAPGEESAAPHGSMEDMGETKRILPQQPPRRRRQAALTVLRSQEAK